MHVYSIEALNTDLPSILALTAKGEEVVLTKNNRPLAKLVPVDDDEAYRREARALRGFAKGIDTEVYREKEDRI